jgi:membrane protease YdiL (CAAX protease family)
MRNIKKIPFIAMIIMAVLSFSNLFGLTIAGASVIIGILFFFINNAYEKRPSTDSGLDIKAIGANMKGKGIWIWLLLPLIMDAVSMTIAKLFVPGYIEHVLERTDIFISFDKMLLMVFQLAILALGEEIAWRAFFQKQLNKGFSIVPVLLISSALFSLGHVTQGNVNIVVYDIVFVFINSILYGIIFYKTNNAWVSAISHFMANLFSIIVLVLL